MVAAVAAEEGEEEEDDDDDGVGDGDNAAAAFGSPLGKATRPISLRNDPALRTLLRLGPTPSFLLDLLLASIFAKTTCGGSEKPRRISVQWLQGQSLVHPKAKQSHGYSLSQMCLTRWESCLISEGWVVEGIGDCLTTQGLVLQPNQVRTERL